MQLTEKQTAVLTSLLSGPGNIPAVHAGKLKAAGYVESTGDTSGARGFANVRITDAGRAAIA
ncbi:helix-turn-helix DNA binding domain protein [Rhodobacter phage RcCWillis]|nr:helix-turn-helix DNA binding domain protein [Rhodobacter phage RcCWillis]